jgi:hypothetical protein
VQHPIGSAVDHEMEHRRIKKEIERALRRTAELRAKVKEIEEHYRGERRDSN